MPLNKETKPTQNLNIFHYRYYIYPLNVTDYIKKNLIAKTFSLGIIRIWA